MPLYEFSCRKCGHCFEKLVTIGDEDSVFCANCSSKDIHKLVSSFGIGGGAYRIRTSQTACSQCTATSCSTCGSSQK